VLTNDAIRVALQPFIEAVTFRARNGVPILIEGVIEIGSFAPTVEHEGCNLA
jgi:hypothetical protein